jgi:putative ABC transport system substrate-binding protein
MPDYQHGSGANFAFTSLDIPIAIQMAYLQQLRGNLKNIAVMYARSNTSAIDTQVTPLKAAAAERGINVIDVVVEDNKQAKQELEQKVPEAVAKMLATDPDGASSVFWITGSTEVYNEIATLARTAGRIPVLSVVPDVVQEGDDSAVLSIGVGFESNAYLAGLYATDILAGRARAGDLKVGVVSPPDIAISFRKAGQVGLKVPFSFFESATFVYDHDGKVIRQNGQTVAR